MRSGTCSKSHYQRSSNILNSSSLPVLVIPGDNDWVDCHNSITPTMAMQRFQNYFIDRFDLKKHALKVQRQYGRKENFVVWNDGVMFFGLNVSPPE